MTCVRRPAIWAGCADTLRCETGGVLPRFEVVARRRPVRLVVPDGGPVRAPYVATSAPEAQELTLASGAVTLTATYGERVALHVSTEGRTTTHRSRRSGQPEAPVEAVALALTGPQVTAFTREAGVWVARARYDLTDRHDVHDEDWLAGLTASGDETGRFGHARSGLEQERVRDGKDRAVGANANGERQRGRDRQDGIAAQQPSREHQVSSGVATPQERASLEKHDVSPT